MGTLVIKSVSNPVLVGSSKGFRLAVESARKAAREKDPVLFQGEIGTGKLLIATFLHRESQRADKPFLVVDCADPIAVTEFLSENIDSGSINYLQGGTIYFREVASLSLLKQAELYKWCIQAETKDIRVILSSSQNVHLLMYDKAFDKDLYRLVSQREVSIPSLRQRKEDLPELIAHFIGVLNLRLRKSIQGLTPQVEQIFATYRWPGNVEEVKQVLTRAIILCNETFIGQRHLMDYLGQAGEEQFSSHDIMPLERMEEILLRSALTRYGYTLEGKKRAARALNISLATLYNKVKRYNLNE